MPKQHELWAKSKSDALMDWQLEAKNNGLQKSVAASDPREAARLRETSS